MFSIFLNIKVYCVFSLESPYRGDSNVNIQYTIFIIKKRKSHQIVLNLQLWDFFSYGLKNEFETSVVNEPSVFEPLKFFCVYKTWQRLKADTQMMVPITLLEEFTS